jgi:hypothetical protein
MMRLAPWPALAGALIVAGCASSPPGSLQGAAGGGSAASPSGLRASPECEAAKLKAVDPLPASAIPDDVLRRAQTGWVAVGYDVVAGRAQNAKVLASQPPGLYDGYVLRHVGTYAEPTGASVRGCLSTTHIRF